MNEDLKYRSKFNKIPAENVGSFSYENSTYASNPELQRLGELARRQAEPAKPDQAIDSSAIDYIKSLDEQLENEHLTPEEVITRASQGVANLRLDYEANYAKYLKEFERAA